MVNVISKKKFEVKNLHNQSYISSLNGTYTVLVNPDLANKWLQFNSHNRPLQKRHFMELAKRMKNKEWCLNGQAIIFSNDGMLMDGQHRLSAVVVSNLSVYFDVRFGIDNNNFSTLDDGKKRTLGDVLALEDVPNYNNIAATINIIATYNYSKNSGHFGLGDRPSNAELLNWYYNHKEIIEYEREGAKMYEQSGRILTKSKFAAYLYLTSLIDKNKSFDFFTKLSLGTNLSSDSIIYKLRTKLIQSKINKSKRMNSRYERAIIIKAWNYFRANKNPKILRFDVLNEKFPIFE